MAIRTLKSYAITALLAIVVLLFTVASLRTEAQQRDQDVIAARQTAAVATIAANTAKMQSLIEAQCDARNDAAAGTNEVLDSLIAAVKATKSLGPDEKVTRLVRYNSAKVALVRCEATP